MTQTQITKLQNMVSKCHTVGGDTLLDYADYLQHQICVLKLSENQEPTKEEWSGRKRWYSKDS